MIPFLAISVLLLNIIVIMNLFKLDSLEKRIKELEKYSHIH